MRLILLVVLGVAGLYGLHRLGLWAERRGWIYYRSKHGSSGTLSNATLEVQSLLEPSKRFVMEEVTRGQETDDGSGDPPTAARPRVPHSLDAPLSVRAAVVEHPREDAVLHRHKP